MLEPRVQAETSTLAEVDDVEAPLMFLYSCTCVCVFRTGQQLLVSGLFIRADRAVAVGGCYIFSSGRGVVTSAVGRRPTGAARALEVALVDIALLFGIEFCE